MATAEVAASLLPENEETDELSGGTATGGIPATTETKEVVEVGDDDEEEEEDYVAPEEPGPEDSSAEKDLEDGTGTGDDEDDNEDEE